MTNVINTNPNSDIITNTIISLISNLLSIYDHMKNDKTLLVINKYYYSVQNAGIPQP